MALSPNAFNTGTGPVIIRAEEFVTRSLGKTLVRMLDNAGSHWIDMRSVLKAVNLGWGRWAMYLRGLERQGRYGLRRHDDDYHKGTVLTRPNQVQRLLADILSQLPPDSHWTARNRIGLLSQEWLGDLLQAKPNANIQAAATRKVTPALVRELHQRRQSGQTFVFAALQLGISASGARRIASGSYPFGREESLAWYETFGGGRPARPVIGAKHGQPFDANTNPALASKNGATARISVCS